MKSGIIKKGNNIFIEFFLENSYFLIKSYDRPLWMSLTIIFIKIIHFLTTLVSPEIIDKIQ